MSTIKFMRSTKGVSIFQRGKNPVSVDHEADNYKAVIKALEAGDEVALEEALDLTKFIMRNADERFQIVDGSLKFSGYDVPFEVQAHIMPIIEANGDLGPMGNFLELLFQNPADFAVREVLTYIAKHKQPITADGHFLAYKRVRKDYKDVHSGTLDNSVGNIVWMPRHAVDQDRNNTCSTGLHFCSKDYLEHFSGDRILVLKISPADVVSIPKDYNESKGRCWRYKVIGELETQDDNIASELESFYVDSFAVSKVRKLHDVEGDGEEYIDDEEFPTDDELLDETEYKVTSTNKQGAKSFAPRKQKKPGQNSLADSTVRSIRNMLDDGLTVAAIARAHETSERTVARIRDGETYTDVV